MTNKQNFIFGRHDSKRHDEYFEIVDSACARLLKVSVDLIEDLVALDKGDQESEDFENDILNLFADIGKSRSDVIMRLNVHLKAMGRK